VTAKGQETKTPTHTPIQSHGLHGQYLCQVVRVQNLAQHIASGERCESVAEKRSKQRTTAYTRLLAHAKDA
jgi:hypothetical protein